MALAWMTRLMDRLRAARPERPGEQAGRVAAIVARRASFRDEAVFLEAVAAELPAGEPVEDGTVQLLVIHLRGHCGEELDRIGANAGPHVDFWAELSRRSGSQLARACHAELVLRTGDPERALEEFVAAVEAEPGLVHFRSELSRLARERGGELWLRFRLACLSAALIGLRPDGDGRRGGRPGTDADRDGDDDGDDDHVRELYCELLEEHRGDPDALGRIRELGLLIDEAVDRGDLPRAIVRRGPRP